jgi:hypothetical protein
MCLALFVLFTWCLASWRAIGRQLFDPYILFLISAFLFSAGQAFLELFDLNERGLLNGMFSEAAVNGTLALVLVSLSSFHLGALVYLSVQRRARSRSHQHPRPVWIRGVGWLLLLISFPPTVMWLSEAITVARSAGYGALYDRDAQTGLSASPFVLSGLFVPALLFLTASGKNHALERRVAAGLIFAFAAIQFYIGYRGTAAMPLIAWAWLRHRALRPIRPGILLAASMALLFVIFPLVRDTRNFAFGERDLGSATRWFELQDNPGFATVNEMGGSMGTVAYTLMLVPTVRDYSRGLDYGYALLTLFPNLFWDIHPTIAHGTHTDWLAGTVYAGINSHGAGLGYSFIAEAYANFGPSGPIFMMAVFGFMVMIAAAWADRTDDPAKLALVAIAMAFVLRFPRDELASIVRPVVWFGFGPYAASILLPEIMRGAARAVRTSATPRKALR